MLNYKRYKKINKHQFKIVISALYEIYHSYYNNDLTQPYTSVFYSRKHMIGNIKRAADICLEY